MAAPVKAPFFGQSRTTPRAPLRAKRGKKISLFCRVFFGAAARSVQTRLQSSHRRINVCALTVVMESRRPLASRLSRIIVFLSLSDDHSEEFDGTGAAALFQAGPKSERA